MRRRLGRRSPVRDHDRARLADQPVEARDEGRRTPGTLGCRNEVVGRRVLKPPVVSAMTAVQLPHDFETPNGDSSVGIFEPRARPRLVLCGIKPEGEEGVVKVPPGRDPLGQFAREPDPLRRHLAVATETRDGVRRKVALQDDRRAIGTRAKLVPRGSGRGTQLPVGFAFIEFHRCIHFRPSARSGSHQWLNRNSLEFRSPQNRSCAPTARPGASAIRPRAASTSGAVGSRPKVTA